MLPIYAGGTSGGHVVWGPSGGYVVGFVAAAGAIGWLAERGGHRHLVTAVLTFAAGQLIVFGVGVPWPQVATETSWSTAIHEGFTNSIIGGLIKAAVAALAAPSAWRFLQRIDDDAA